MEWKALGEVVIFQNAKPHEKLVSKDGDIALLTAGFISSEGRSVRLVKRDDVLTHAIESDVALVMSDLPNGRALAKTFFVEESDRFAANRRVCLLRVKDLEQYVPKFLHYVMNRNRQLLAYDSGCDQTHLKKDWILEVQIPIPPLPIQKEIVRILDTFTELTHRKKQYNHYRDQLLNFEDGEVEWKTLGEIVIVKMGASVNKDLIAANPGNFPVINSGREPLGYINQWNTENDPIGMTTRGAGVGSVTWQEGKYFRGNLNYSVSIKDCSNLNLRFLYHSLLHRQRDIQAICTYDGIPAFNAGNLKELKIPIPYGNDPKKSLAEQARIVAILDKFDTITHFISEGLPREIELRQKQYEHYRNLLLSFPMNQPQKAQKTQK